MERKEEVSTHTIRNEKCPLTSPVAGILFMHSPAYLCNFSVHLFILQIL